jgi:hypothetical protein
MLWIVSGGAQTENILPLPGRIKQGIFYENEGDKIPKNYGGNFTSNPENPMLKERNIEAIRTNNDCPSSGFIAGRYGYTACYSSTVNQEISGGR